MIYTQFFSRIPINKAIDLKYLRTGIKWLWLFGAIMGTLLAGVYFIVQLFLPVHLAWIVTLLADVLLSAGFHLDALADTADGLFSSRKKERMLEIMKDSRVGSNGVLALIFFYAMMITVSWSLPMDAYSRMALVLSISSVGKAGLACQTYNMTYARSESGLGHVFSGASTIDIAIAQVCTAILVTLLLGVKALACLVVVWLVAAIYRQFVYGKIDGHTGDTLGAFVNIAQLLFLLGMSV